MYLPKYDLRTDFKIRIVVAKQLSMKSDDLDCVYIGILNDTSDITQYFFFGTSGSLLKVIDSVDNF